MKNLSALGELGLIDWIKDSCAVGSSVKKGIGDDTAVLPFSKQEDLLLTTDMSVEGTHFTSNTSPELIGRKALARNLSDIAAMGGKPTFAVVSLGLPKKIKADVVKKIYKGVNDLAAEFGVYIVGGDTVKSEKIVIDVTLLGKVAKNKAVLRSGAKRGDQIFVSGRLGGSLKSGRHLTFTPRIREAQYLVKNIHPTAMIDISDGLAGDLGHILEQSKVGGVLFESHIPRNPGATLEQALFDGEDFELLFTVKSKDAKKLSKKFHHIGEIEGNAPKLFLVNKNHQREELVPKGYQHFV